MNDQRTFSRKNYGTLDGLEIYSFESNILLIKNQNMIPISTYIPTKMKQLYIIFETVKFNTPSPIIANSNQILSVISENISSVDSHLFEKICPQNFNCLFLILEL